MTTVVVDPVSATSNVSSSFSNGNCFNWVLSTAVVGSNLISCRSSASHSVTN